MELTVEGDPVSWARPRFNGRRGFSASKQANAKTDLQWLLTEAWGKRDPIARGIAVAINLEFHFRAPRKMDIGNYKTTKPDIDNLLKLVLDAANGIVWWDDGQVVQTTVTKLYAEKAATVIKLWKIEEPHASGI